MLTESAKVAQEEGYIEDELKKVGYYPDYQAFAQAGPAINEAIASNKADFAVYADFPVITAVSNGVGIKIIGSTNSAFSFGILGADGIKSVKDLKGKRVCVGFGTVTYMYLEKILEKNGLKTDDLKLINTNTDGPTMLTSGDADAVVSTYFGILQMNNTYGIGNVIEDSVLSGGVGTYVLAANQKTLDEKPEAAEAVLKALNRAYELAKENPDKALQDLTSKSTNIDIVKQGYSDTGFEYFNPSITDDTRKAVQATIDFMKENQLIKTEINPDDVIDTSYYEKAVG